MTSFRFAVNVLPKPGILDPQGRAVEGSLGHLGIEGVSAVRVGRRVELTVEAADDETRPAPSSSGWPRSCSRTRSSRRTRSKPLGATSSLATAGRD